MKTIIMKNRFRIFLVVVCSGMLLAGCGAEILTTTAIRGELEAQNIRHANQQLGLVQRRMDTLGFNQAVQAYRAEHGVNPPSLEALVPKYLAKMPLKPDGTPYHYDPATATLSESPAAGGVTPADQQMMLDIRNAINQYGTAIGYYPPTLDALYPTYLAQLPRTSAGEPFFYNNQNGDVVHPRAHAVPTPSGAGGRGGGVGPMGEIMTGVGMQQSLGGGNSAAGAVRSRARSGADAISGQHNDRQNQVMDDLGL